MRIYIPGNIGIFLLWIQILLRGKQMSILQLHTKLYDVKCSIKLTYNMKIGSVNIYNNFESI